MVRSRPRPCLKVEIFKAGGKAELGVFEPVAHPAVFQIGHLVIDQQAEALLKGELCHVGGLHLVGKALAMAASFIALSLSMVGWVSMWIPLGGVILGASDIIVGCGNAVHLAGSGR